MSFGTTGRADQDIIDIYVQGAGQFGIAHAERYRPGLLAVFDLLADNPRVARLRMEFSPPGADACLPVADGCLHGGRPWHIDRPRPARPARLEAGFELTMKG